MARRSTLTATSFVPIVIRREQDRFSQHDQVNMMPISNAAIPRHAREGPAETMTPAEGGDALTVGVCENLFSRCWNGTEQKTQAANILTIFSERVTNLSTDDDIDAYNIDSSDEKMPWSSEKK